LRIHVIFESVLIAGLLTGTTGCAGSAAARHSALKLQAQAGLYQSQIDAKIAQQRKFYEDQLTAIDDERGRARPFAIDQLREERALRTASAMSSDPGASARMAALVDHLLTTTDAEYALYVQLYRKQMDTRREVEDLIGKLQRKRDALDKVKSSLAELASEKSSGSHARDVLAVAEQAVAKIQAGK